jgi:hypothetical protein
MNRNDDIERVLEHWLADGPVHMSDRLFDGTFERIDALPKRRLAGRAMRLPAMNLNLRIAALAAVLVATASAGLFVMSRNPSAGVRPTPSPTSSTASGLSPTAIRTALEWKWTSVGHRTDATIVFRKVGLEIYEFKGPILSGVVVLPNGELQVQLEDDQATLVSQHWPCRTGDVGTYNVGFPAAHQKLILVLINDACSARAAILGGEWLPWPCSNPDSDCQPELTPGRHVSDHFWPIVTPASDSNNKFAYVVPAGWSVTNDTDRTFSLGRPNDPGNVGINVSLDVAPHSQAADCPDAREPGIDTTAVAISSWLSTLPGLVATAPTAAVIDGHHGAMLDLHVASSRDAPCQFSNVARTVFTLTDLVPSAESLVRDYLDGDTYSRYILLDLPGGHNMLIEVTAPAANWTDLVSAAMPIVESFKFTP